MEIKISPTPVESRTESEPPLSSEELELKRLELAYRNRVLNVVESGLGFLANVLTKANK